MAPRPRSDGWVLARDAAPSASRTSIALSSRSGPDRRAPRRSLEESTPRSALRCASSPQRKPPHDPDSRAERLIVALDVPTPARRARWSSSSAPAARFYKVGLELFMAGGYFELVDWLAGRGHKVFADLKFFDIPETVARASPTCAGRGITFAHGARQPGDDEGRGEEKGRDEDPRRDGAHQPRPRRSRRPRLHVRREQLVLSRARRAMEAGCDGVISSGLEAPRIKSRVRRTGCSSSRRASGPWRTSRRTTRSAPSTWRRPSRTAPTTSSSAGRSAQAADPRAGGRSDPGDHRELFSRR